MSDGRIVTIKQAGRFAWTWDVWWRGASGGGPFAHGRTRTRWGARRKTKNARHP